MTVASLLNLIGTCLVVISAGVVVNHFSARHWKRQAARVGLAYSGGFFDGREITGRRDGLLVQVSQYGQAYKAVVDGGGAIPADLGLNRENLLSRVLKPDIATGDDDFDGRARITGPRAAALALLGYESRGWVRKLVLDGDIKVSEGRVQLLRRELRQVIDAVPAMVALAHALSIGEDEVVERLAANVADDPEPGVRLHSLLALAEDYPGHEVTEATLRQALESPQSELCLAAAIKLGEEGRDAVIGVAESDAASDETRARAIEHLSRRWPGGDTIAILERLLDARSAAARRAAVSAFGRLGHRAAGPRLIELARGPDPEVSEAVAEALGEIGEANAEACLVQLLDRPEGRVQEAAVRSLAKIGTTVAVEPLLPIARRVTPGALRSAARDAVERIQARIEGGERGQLSVAGAAEHAGGLSAADNNGEGGELSLEDQDESQ
jgi:HEAT repeat protein